VSARTPDAAYVPPREGYETLDRKLAANGRATLHDPHMVPEWGEVRVLMRKHDALREVETAARQLVWRDIPMSVVALCEANLIAALADLEALDAEE
jgi:hypothetical protein